jgi:hypothetical protein
MKKSNGIRFARCPKAFEPGLTPSDRKMADDVGDQLTVTALVKKQQDCPSYAIGS